MLANGFRMKSKLRAPGPPSSSSWPVFALRPSFHHVLATSQWSKVQDWGSILLQVRSPLLGHVPCIPPHPYRALDVHSELIPRRSPGATPLREPCPWTRPHRERPCGEVSIRRGLGTFPACSSAQTRPRDSGRVNFRSLGAASTFRRNREESVSLAPVVDHEGNRGILPSSFTALFPEFVHSYVQPLSANCQARCSPSRRVLLVDIYFVMLGVRSVTVLC